MPAQYFSHFQRALPLGVCVDPGDDSLLHFATSSCAALKTCTKCFVYFGQSGRDCYTFSD